MALHIATRQKAAKLSTDTSLFLNTFCFEATGGSAAAMRKIYLQAFTIASISLLLQHAIAFSMKVSS